MVSTAHLLASGGDSRHTLARDMRNRYGCSYVPDPAEIDFGSCTASTVSEVGFAAAERVHGWLQALADDLATSVDDLFEHVRDDITRLVVLPSAAPADVVLSPSGTDAEYIPLLVAAAKGLRVVNIVVGPTEAGSGSAVAAAGQHFDPVCPDGSRVEVGTPVDAEVAARTVLHRVAVRRPDGSLRPVGAIDSEVEGLVERAVEAGAQPLLHVIAHSKTGIHAPSLEKVTELCARFPGGVLVVIDAAQGRFSRRGLRDALDRGHMAITSGSKFFGGPPFEGAVLIPHSLREQHGDLADIPEAFGAYWSAGLFPRHWEAARHRLPEEPNLGLLVRWFAALADMRDYYHVPSTLRLAVLRTFERLVPEILGASPYLDLEQTSAPVLEDKVHRLLESKKTVFAFLCRRAAGGEPLSHEGMAVLHRLMLDDLSGTGWGTGPVEVRALAQRVMLGQPVALTSAPDGPSMLRIALGGRQIVRACVMVAGGRTFDERLAALEEQIVLTRTKLEVLLRGAACWDEAGT